jgi:starvation-inducible DNA-binding protein
MDELIEALKKAQADTFAFYLKAHNYHWNVESHAFSLYHAFFGTLYEDAFDAVDTIAEHTRTLDAYVPGSFTRFKELATIEDEVNVPSAKTMIEKLESDNKKVIETLTDAYKAAEAANKIGISNFLQDRIDTHEKHGWMLRSHLKG